MPPPTPPMDPEYAQWASTFFPATPSADPPPRLPTIQEMRPQNDAMITMLYAPFTPHPPMQITTYTIPSPSLSGPPLHITHFLPPDLPPSTLHPALLHFHGGGYVGGSIAIVKPYVATIAAKWGIQIFSVEYRLAPEDPYPAAHEDGVAALKWLVKEAEGMGVDRERIGVVGESAGGGLAAGVAVWARDYEEARQKEERERDGGKGEGEGQRGEEDGLKIKIARLLLIYPMLDDRSFRTWSLHPTLTTDTLSICWRAYVGDNAGDPDADISPYAAPGRAASLEGMPATYIDVGGLDDFRDECCEFAARLAREGNEVEFHLWPGVPHGFDVARGVGVVGRALGAREAFVRRL